MPPRNDLALALALAAAAGPAACADRPAAPATPPASAAPSSAAAPAAPAAAAQDPPPPTPPASPAPPAIPPVTAAIDHPGCFLLQNLETGATTTVHPEICARPAVPASTFKIPHALIALETGVVADPHAQVRWDGTRYTNKDWESDQSLATALQVSAVWFFQRTARAIGRPRMQSHLRNFNYGNKKVSRDITHFWLDHGSLEITALEQLQFLFKMTHHDLPVAREHIDTVWTLLRADPALLNKRLPAGETWPNTTAVIEAKTGTADGVSWWVGRLDGPRGPHLFVSRIDGLPASRTSAALSAGLHALRAADVL